MSENNKSANPYLFSNNTLGDMPKPSEVKLTLSDWDLIQRLGKNKQEQLIERLQKNYTESDTLLTRKEWIKEGKKSQASTSSTSSTNNKKKADKPKRTNIKSKPQPKSQKDNKVTTKELQKNFTS